MLKLITTRNGKSLIGFGIDAENIRRLKDGKPILVHLDELGIENIDVFITYGETLNDIKKDLKDSGLEFLDADTSTK